MARKDASHDGKTLCTGSAKVQEAAQIGREDFSEDAVMSEPGGYESCRNRNAMSPQYWATSLGRLNPIRLPSGLCCNCSVQPKKVCLNLPTPRP